MEFTYEIEILKKNYGLGNDILYGLCKNMPLERIINGESFFWNNNKYLSEEALAAQMWLIGRSYSASPERRYYKIEKNKNNHEKLKLSSSGDGLDTYFDLLANELLEKIKGDKDLINALEKLNCKYNFDEDKLISDSDKETLKESINVVLKFNELLKETRFLIDKNDIEDYINNKLKDLSKINIKNLWQEDETNALSFCSKFLHFHYPNTVFIMDNITKDHFKGRGKELKFKFKFNNKCDITESCITVVKQEVRSILIDTFQFDKNYKETDVEKDKEALYIKHCVREYLLAKAIYNKDKTIKTIFDEKYIPRIIDTYMLMANTK